MNRIAKLVSFIMAAVLMLTSCSGVARKTEREYPLQKESEYFNIYADESEMCVERIYEELERQYKLINRNFNTEFSKKVNITIYPSIDLFKKRIGNEEIPDWLGAVRHKKENEIVMLSPANTEYKYSSMNMIMQAKMELIEIMLDDMPVYLSFGITRYETGLSTNVAEAVVSAFEKDNFPTIAQLKQLKEDGELEWQLITYAFVEFVVDKFGYSKLARFVENQNVKKVFGMSEEEFDKEWREYAESSYNACKLQKETEHFVVYSDGTNLELVNKVANVLEENYDRVTGDLRVNLDSKIKMTICPDTEYLQRRMRSAYETEVSARMQGFADDKGINVVDPDGASVYISEEDLLQTTVHEFVHAVTYRINMNVPSYLAEGIATYETGDDYYVKIKILKLINTDKFPTMQALAQNAWYDDSVGVYQLGYAFVQYVVEKYGYDKLVEIVGNYDINAVFGVGEDEFRTDWIEYLKEIYK